VDFDLVGLVRGLRDGLRMSWSLARNRQRGRKCACRRDESLLW
jgi:hypothetical protein